MALMPDRDQHDLAELDGLAVRPDIRLIATDMDGTLLGDDKEIHDEFWPLVEELHGAGVTFCPASGRQYYALREQFAGIADEAVFIAENGTFVLDGNGREIASDCMTLESAQAVIRATRTVDHTRVVLCGKRSAYIDQTDEAFLAEVTPYYHRLEIVDDLRAVLDDAILKVAVFDFASAEHNSGAALSGFRPALQVVVSGEHWVDVMSPTANKGEAVRWVQRALHVTPDQTMVFGDFLNDLEMMDAATYSFAMANAHPLLKDRASWIAPTNNANGVVRTIRTVMGLGRGGQGRPVS